MSLIVQNRIRADKVMAFLTADDDRADELHSKLSPKDLEMLDRWTKADDLIRQYRSEKKVVNIMMKLFSISRSQCYRDIEAAKYVFATINPINKAYTRSIALEWQMEMMRKAANDGDFANFNRGMANLIKIAGLDREDEEPISWADLQMPTQILVGNFRELLPVEIPDDFEQQIEKLKAMNKANFQADDAEFEESLEK